MPPEIERLQLTPTDTVVTVRERLASLRGRRVLLIWPADGKPLERKLDIVLIQRDADRRAIQLALVSKDKAITAHAAELNISCFASIEASQVERWKRGRQKRFLPRYHKPSPDLQTEDLAIIADRIERRKRGSTWRAAIERIVVLALLIGVIGSAFYVVIPSAVVELTLAEQEIVAVVDILADSKANAVNLEQGVIPALTLRETVETSATIPASGIFPLDSVSAAGVVTFTNLGNALAIIPAKTILGTSAGEPILFETVADIVVPGGIGRSVDATVQAREGYRGSIGNVSAGMINTVIGALAEKVSVINLTPAAGGGAPSVKVVAEVDKVRLLESVRIQLQSLAFEQMRATLPDSQVIVIESLGVDEERKEWIRYSADVGAMTSELSLSMRAVVAALAIDDRYARQVAVGSLKANLPPDKILVGDSIEYSRGPFTIGRVNGKVQFTAATSASARSELDLGALRAALAGLSLDEALALLLAKTELSAFDPPVLNLYPKGLARMPMLPIRIDLQIKGAT
ncbi:MAG: hypothetical protein F4X87_12635 [Chloroflexi bacterium]|nr:hypothetical protein [Chloroflexota bacterium]